MAPFPARQQGRMGDDDVVRQGAGRLRRAAAFQIGGAGDQKPPHRTEPRCHQAGIRQMGDADGQVHPLIDQVHDPVEQQHRDPDRRIRGAELLDDRAQQRAPRHHRGRDRDFAGRLACLTAQALFHRVQVGQQAPSVIEESGSWLGQMDGARGSVEQAHAQAMLQRRDGPRDGGRGTVQRAGRAGEPASLGHGDEHPQFLEAVDQLLRSPEWRVARF